MYVFILYIGDRVKQQSGSGCSKACKFNLYSLKDYCHTMPLLLITFCSILSKTKNNVKNTLFTSILVRIRQNDQILVKDCFVIRWITKIFFIVMSQIKWPLAAN